MPYDPASTLISTDGEPPLAEVVERMLSDFAAKAAAPPSASGLPDPSLTLVNMTQKAVGIGRMRGHESVGPLALVSLKGGRLDAVVRYELWHSGASEVDAAITQLQSNLLAARDELRTLGFLKIEPSETSTAERIPSGMFGDGIWRKAASYRTLYEYRYRDAGGAESLIHRIPVHADPEQTDSPDRETSVVTGATVRWDNEQAAAMRLRGARRIARLRTAAFVPGATPGGDAVLLRTHDGADGPPFETASLDSWLDAVTGEEPAHRHARLELAFSDLLAAFEPADDTAELGDWDLDDDADSYQLRRLELPAAIVLPAADDRLEIAYQPAPFDETSVVYLHTE